MLMAPRVEPLAMLGLGGSVSTPRTGITAAVAVEDAEMLHRMQARGVTPVVTLKMEAETLRPAESANVIAELRGSAPPEEIVVIGGHAGLSGN